MDQVSNLIYAYQATNGGYIGVPYSKLDCQGFVEKVLADCGIKKDWRGSNDMWRNALSWKGTIKEAEAKFGRVPFGAWLFTIKHDGGEVERGYHDDQGNAVHVGIRIQDSAIHSTVGGVQYCAFPDPKRWTHVGLCKYIDFSGYTLSTKKEKLMELYNMMTSALNEMKDIIGGITE